MENKIEVGKAYRMSGIEVVCVGYTKKGYAKMQTLGMTHGEWPGEGDISNYNHITRKFTNEWKGTIKKFRLPTHEKAEMDKTTRIALSEAAGNRSSFGASSYSAWLGTVNGSNYAWCISSYGNVYSDSYQDDSYVIAPSFNIDESKIIILDGDEIKRLIGHKARNKR